MGNAISHNNQIQVVTHFNALISHHFMGEINAICWERELAGDFGEIVQKVKITGNITTITLEELHSLSLTENGQRARAILLQDFTLLQDYGAQPILNVIQHYDKDDAESICSTDVYSFHIDRSPLPVDTFLCTYYGDSGEILPNAHATQKVLIPEISEALRKQYQGSEEGFKSYLEDYFYDLHYAAKPDAHIVNLGLGNIWRIAVDHPSGKVLPCIHRAPEEHSGQYRLLLIC